MSTNEFLPDDLRRCFNKGGQRFTPQREEVWRLFESSASGHTVAEATELLGPRGIGQSTVYRTVKALQDLGYLKWVHDRHGEHRFIATRPGHTHLLVCRRCSRTMECGDCDLALLEKLIAVKTGFVIEGHHLEFFGLCGQCAASPDQGGPDQAGPARCGCAGGPGPEA
jgi:Fur family ferric uptake transcriptional regulator/Fur family peroxide stress response transcriptional regulator